MNIDWCLIHRHHNHQPSFLKITVTPVPSIALLLQLFFIKSNDHSCGFQFECRIFGIYERASPKRMSGTQLTDLTARPSRRDQ